MSTITSTPLVSFKKGPRSRPQQSRKRTPSPTAEAGPSTLPSKDESAVIRPTKKSLLNPLVQGTKRRRDLNEDSSGGLDELDYKADQSGALSKDNFATRSSDWDLEVVDGNSTNANNGNGNGPLGEKKVRLNEDGEIDDGLYHGSANYMKTVSTRPDSSMSSKMKTGPIRATANIRTITLVDYQPDVCKDYKETGFCGYGDSCKFLHDRGDYLAGWQLDKMGEEVKVVEEEEEEEVPFACLICRQEFTEPVVTKCGHYFCMKCAINRFIKSPKCYACGAATSGIFNKAEKILAKLEAKRDRQREERGWKPDEDDTGGIEFGGGGDGDGDGDGQEEEEEGLGENEEEEE